MKRSFAGIFIPLVIYYVVGTIIREIAIFYLMNREHLLDMAALQERYVQGGVGILVTGITALLVIPLFGYRMRKLQKQEENRKNTLPGGLYWLLLIPFGIFAAMGPNQLISLLSITEISQSYSQTRDALFSGSFAVSVLILGVLVPVAEELLFRGLVYTKLKELCKPKTAIFLSALLFGIYHFNLPQFLYAALIGLVLAFVYDRMKSILAPVILHGTANLFVYLAGDFPCFQQKPAAYLTCALGFLGLGALIWFYGKENSNNSKEK